MAREYLDIEGGNPLNGTVRINGSKNSVLAIIPAMCLGDGTGVICNAPSISDVEDMKGILAEIGMHIEEVGEGSIKVMGQMKYSRLSPTHVSRIRASNLFLGTLLSKFGRVEMPMPGGDKIGDRPLDIHLYVFNKFGIRTEVRDGYINCEATEFPYQGQTIFLRYPSVGATENAMLIAALAEGPSVIYNAAMEPEVIDMAILLNGMGASISGAGTPVLRIKPASRLKKTRHELIPDRLEAGTFLIAFAATRGRGIIHDAVPEHLISLMTILNDSGISIAYNQRRIVVNGSRREFLDPVNVYAMPYPGLPTDMQPLMAAYAATCSGVSHITDSVYRERFYHLNEMRSMGLEFERVYDQAIIPGPQKLAGAEVEGRDIRTAAALVLAALVAGGRSRVYGLKHINRGYDDFVAKMRSLGARISVRDE